MRQIRVIIAAVVFSALIVSCGQPDSDGASNGADNNNEMVFTEDEAQEDEGGLEFSEEEAEAEPDSLGHEYLDWVEGVPTWEVRYGDSELVCGDEGLVNVPPEVQIEQGYLFFLEGVQKLQVESLGLGTVILERTIFGPEGAFYEGTREVGGVTQALEISIYEANSYLLGSISATIDGCKIKRFFTMHPLD